MAKIKINCPYCDKEYSRKNGSYWICNVGRMKCSKCGREAEVNKMIKVIVNDQKRILKDEVSGLLHQRLLDLINEKLK